jgi:peptidoglycan-associated lipoprotein
MSMRACKQGLLISLLLGGADLLLLNLWIAPRVIADSASPPPRTLTASAAAFAKGAPDELPEPAAPMALAQAEPEPALLAPATEPAPPAPAEAEPAASRSPSIDVPAREPAAAETPAETEAADRAAPADLPTTGEPDSDSARRVTLYFGTDRATLSAEHRGQLDRLVAVLATDRSLGLEIDGHADARGSPYDNNHLSRRRSERVATYLRDQGVAGRRLHLRSFGERRPVVPGWTADALQQNRRVELLVLEETP